MAINAGLGLTIDAASALEINSTGGAISVGNDAVAGNIEIGNSATARSIIVGNAPSTTTEIELNAALVDINAGSGGLDVDVSGNVAIDASGTVDITIAAAPSATPGYSINLTAGRGTGDGDRAGGNIILTPGTKAGAGPIPSLAVRQRWQRP